MMVPMDRMRESDETSKMVALGRDRDAASRQLAGMRSATELESTSANPLEDPLDTIQQLDTILPALEEIVRNIGPDQMTNATPCTEFDVRGVFNHMIGGAVLLAPQFRGDPPPDPPADGTDLTGDDATGAFKVAIDALGDALRQPGAFDRTVVAPFGPAPGDVVARFLALDGMVHTWDLAVATGQTYDPDEPVVVEVLAFAHQIITPELRAAGAFGAEVPAPRGATPFQQLLAFTGRTA